MISIVICSRDNTLLNAVSQSIKETIGLPYEIIAIDNRESKYGICKAYNLGASKAKYDIFCFMHEDIAFVTQNWGVNVLSHLKDERVGLIGIAGAEPKLIVPASFDASILNVETNIIYDNIKDNECKQTTYTSSPDDDSIIKQVVGVDGVWLCTKRSVFEKFKFDELTLTGFHGYDIDFSLQVFSEFKVCVVFDILLKHYSCGRCDRKYVAGKLEIYKKWRKKLPMSYRKHSDKEYLEFHWRALNNFMGLIINLKYNYFFVLYYFFVFSCNRFFSIKPFFKVLKKVVVQKLV